MMVVGPEEDPGGREPEERSFWKILLTIDVLVKVPTSHSRFFGGFPLSRRTNVEA